jgi:hypothetical protein
MTDLSTTAAYDRHAERATLAACLTSTVAREEARRHLVGADFYEPRHETIWNAISRLERHGKHVDPTTLHAVLTERAAIDLLPELVTYPAVPEHITDYARIVRKWSTQRQVVTEARQIVQRGMAPDLDAVGYAASLVTRFAAIRDSGLTDDAGLRTLAEILTDPDDAPDWLIPGYLERRDRLMLTGEEGKGKSHLLRQFAIFGAAGIDPFDPTDHERFYPPIRTMIVDCENSDQQVKRRSRTLAAFAGQHGVPDPTERVAVLCTNRLDVTRDKDLAQLHREIDAWQPDLVVIGPLYRLIPKAIQTDDEAAPVLAALDTLRDRGCALLVEAHAGHAVGKGGVRDMRPRGSSALLGWPEFGYGMRDLGARGGRYMAFVAWRGDRSERDWPTALRRSDDGRWVPYDGPTEIGDIA